MRLLTAACIALASTLPVSAHQVRAPDGTVVDYSGWERNGMDCCGGRDCAPAPWRLNPTTLDEEVCPGSVSATECIPPAQWRPVDRRKLLPGISRDGRAHVCTAGGAPDTYIRCIKLPGFGA